MAASSPTSSIPDEKGSFVEPPAPTARKSKLVFWRRSEKENNGGKEENASLGDSETDLKPKEELVPSVSFPQLFRFSTKFELFIDAVGLVAAIATGAAQPLMTLFFAEATQNFVDFTIAVHQVKLGVPGADEMLSRAAQDFRKSTATNATYFVYLGIALFVCTYAYMYIWVYTGEINAKRIRERYLKAILRQDIAYFDNVGAGEVTTRIQTDTHLIQTGISEKVALTFQYLGSFLTGFILAYARSWRLALAMSSILPVIAITGGIMNTFVSRFAELALKHTAEGGNFAEETISTVRTAQAFGVQKVLSKRYNTHIDGSLKADLNGAIWQGGGFAIFFFVVYAAYGLAFSFGMTLINRGQANASQVINVFLAILIGSFSLAMLAPELQAINQACGAAAKVYATIDRVPDIDSANPGGERPDHVKGEITLENVCFSYPSRPSIQVAKGLNLTFQAGQTVALVGASGSGKSTIISLVERFYDPSSGVLKLDGRNLKDLNLKWLRSQIGLVSQEPVLFSTTIKGNVAHGLINTPYENATDEVKDKLIKEACIKANADGFISNLPLGYETMVGERGFLLSGGQKQRVAIARAIVSDPKILLLDEATSALDTRSEGVVQDALDKASAGRTTIAIAHRLSTVKDADVIYVMAEGCVIEHGTHTQLIQAKGAYARLVQAQKLKERHDDPEDESSAMEKPTNQELSQEIPLGRSNTHRSLASEILAKKQENEIPDESTMRDHGLPYLFRRLAPIISDQKLYYILGFLFACLTGMVYPAFGVVFAKGLDAFTLQTNAERRFAGDRTALWLFVISIASFLSVGCQYYMFARSAATLTARLRERVYKAILRQDIEYFDRDENSTGALTSGLSENPQKVNGLAGTTLGAIVQCVSTLVSGSILGLVFLWKVGLVGMACTPVLIAMGFIRLRVVVLKDQVNRKAHSQSAQVACEAAGSIRTVAALTREDDCLRVYSASLEGPLQHSKQRSVWSSLLFALSQASVYFIIALLFWYGSLLVSRFEASMFQFFVALMSTTFAALDAGEMFSYVPDMSSARGAGSKIIKLFDSVPDIDADSLEGKKIDNTTVNAHIVVDNVHFRYPTRPGVRVVRGLSLEIKPGQYVALVGASGCGKSTLIQLLERFYDPIAGEIYFDGEKISEYNVQEYRKQLALVSQEPTLYAGSIRFNILLGAVKPSDEVTEEEMERACKDANIWEFIQGLPNQLDTEVGGKGSQLSGGQKQRIAIARALIRNPKLLLLDEATSALDSNSEKVVQEALDRAAKGRTTVAIAHRLSTIQNADVIYFIKDGQVSEAGTHNQLLERKGDYFEYVQLQTLGDSK